MTGAPQLFIVTGTTQTAQANGHYVLTNVATLQYTDAEMALVSRAIQPLGSQTSEQALNELIGNARAKDNSDPGNAGSADLFKSGNSSVPPILNNTLRLIYNW